MVIVEKRVFIKLKSNPRKLSTALANFWQQKYSFQHFGNFLLLFIGTCPNLEFLFVLFLIFHPTNHKIKITISIISLSQSIINLFSLSFGR